MRFDMLEKKKFSNPSFDVTGVGGAAWDFLGVITKNPVPGEKEQIIEMTQQGGGQTGTAISTVARLGGKAAIIGATGDDEFGQKIRESLRVEGVDISHMQIDRGKTSHIAFCMILSEGGDRTIFFNRGTKKFLEADDVDEEVILNSRCLITDTHHIKASVRAAEIARSSGIYVVTDIEKPTRFNDTLFKLATHNIIPFRFLLETTGEKDLENAMHAWREKYTDNILVATLGEKGSIACTGKEIIRQEAYKIDPVVDTTGAGDVFHGAFAYGLTLEYDLCKNLKFASLVSGLKCRSLGGRAGIPTEKELKKYWKS